MIYDIQHRIETLAQNAVAIETGMPVFDCRDIAFSQWEFNTREAWKHKCWLAQGTVEAANVEEAFRIFGQKLTKIVPRIALISQCYIESMSQPFLILKSGVDVGLFKFMRDRGATGLMFLEKQQKALNLLVNNAEIPDVFFYYWNHAVNTYEYPSKLLLMLSALESLAKKGKGKKDWDKLERILGVELLTSLWGTPKDHYDCLRHRLTHGEYFNLADSGKDYFALVHNRVVKYFNEAIFSGEKLIDEDVVNAPRHPFGNKEGGGPWLIRARGSNQLNLKNVLSDILSHDFYRMVNYEIMPDNSLRANY